MGIEKALKKYQELNKAPVQTHPEKLMSIEDTISSYRSKAEALDNIQKEMGLEGSSLVAELDEIEAKYKKGLEEINEKYGIS